MNLEKKKNETQQNVTRLILFNFELNYSQASLFLILSLIGILIFSKSLVSAISMDIFYLLFNILPDYYNTDISWSLEDYLFLYIGPVLINIITFTLGILLSIYILRKILRRNHIKYKDKRKIIPQERMVNWLGLKISHGQSLFLFSVSICMILYLVPIFLITLLFTGRLYSGLLMSICIIPTEPNFGILDPVLFKNVSLALEAIFLLLCIYTLIITRRGKPINTSKKNTMNYSLLIFIVSFVVLIFLSARIFCHLALFNPDISNLLGITHNPTNKYQNNDFILTIVLFIICLAFMIISFFLKESSDKQMEINKELSWLQIRLTPYKTIFLLSVAFSLIIFFSEYCLNYIFIYGIGSDFPSDSDFLIIILISIIIFCYYPIEKILKNYHFNKTLENIDKTGDFKTNWFKFRLDKIYSVILFCVTFTLVGYSIFMLFWINDFAVSHSSLPYPYTKEFLLFSLLIMYSYICLILVVLIYTIKKTFPSIKSQE